MNRRFIQALTLLMMSDHDQTDPKQQHQVESLYMAFVSFGDVLAGVDGDLEDVITKIVAADPIVGGAAENFRQHLLNGREAPTRALTKKE